MRPRRPERLTDGPADGLVIRPMTEADLPEVLAIERASFPVPWDETLIRAEMDHELARCRVLLRDGRVVGNLFYWLVAGEVELHNVAVHPDARGEGYGRRLVLHLIEQGRRSGAERVSLEVRRGNAAAVALYARLGFLTVGVRARYYQDNHEDALIMQLELRPEVARRGDEAWR